MSDDGKKNPRDNVTPKLKPKDVKTENVAPPGHMGITSADAGLTPGGSVKVVRMTVDVAVQENEPEPELSLEEQRAEYLNNLPDNTEFTLLTGDEMIDKQSVENGDVPVTKEELAAIQDAKSPQPQESTFDQMMQDDGATHFQKTNDPQVNQHYEERGETLVHSDTEDHGLEDGAIDNPFGAKGDLERAFNRVKGHEVARGQTKGPEPS